MKNRKIDIISLIITTIIFQAILAYIVYQNLAIGPNRLDGDPRGAILGVIIVNIIVAILSTIITYKILRNKPYGINILANIVIQLAFMNMALNFSFQNFIEISSIVPKVIALLMLYCFSKIKDKSIINVNKKEL